MLVLIILGSIFVYLSVGVFLARRQYQHDLREIENLTWPESTFARIDMGERASFLVVFWAVIVPFTFVSWIITHRSNA